MGGREKMNKYEILKWLIYEEYEEFGFDKIDSIFLQTM